MLDPDKVQQITNFLNIDAPVQPAQLAFVFGNSLTLPAERAAALFSSNLFPTLSLLVASVPMASLKRHSIGNC